MGLRKPTELLRITCTQELRCVVEAEDAPSGTERNIQLLVPDGAEFHFTIDAPGPLDVALGRSYRAPLVPGGQSIEFRLQPEQKIYGMVTAGIGEASVIIEYLEAD